MTTQLHDDIALVTGASRGLGSAIAAELASLGAIVVGTATTADGAQRIASALKQHHNLGDGMVLDVTDADAIDTLINQVNDNYGPVSVLVNNAGITSDNLLMRMKEEEWDSIIDTDLTSVFRLSKACLRGMIKARKGRIINITSVVGLTGNAGQCNYAAAKAGIIGFTRSLAREVGSRNITVNAVAPGFIDTDMTRKLSKEQVEALKDAVPLSRLGTIMDVAKAVAFLASPEAGYITGQTLHVNGGMYMG